MRAIDPDGMERARARQANRSIQDAIDDDRPDRLMRRLHALKRRERRKIMRRLAPWGLALSVAGILVWAIAEAGL